MLYFHILIFIIGIHSGENLASIVSELLGELNIRDKLLSITADNASNNSALVDNLHIELLQDYEDYRDPSLEAIGGSTKPLMRFRGQKHYIRCAAHTLNLIVKDILNFLKSSSLKEALQILGEQINRSTRVQAKNQSPIAKLRLIILWIQASTQWIQKWKTYNAPKIIHYDMDSCWNSTYHMIKDAIECQQALMVFIRLDPFYYCINISIILLFY